jgi:hypothetical protein
VVAYKPPDRVLMMVGASFRGEPLCQAALRMAALAAIDNQALARFGIPLDTPKTLKESAGQIENMLRDRSSKKHDTPLQMAELAELMSRCRRWLEEMRDLAALNLSLDTPSLEHVFSAAPETADGYPRDLLVELEGKIKAARDMKPRVEDVGINEKFLGTGSRLALQLKTAIGKEDLDAKNLSFLIRRLYLQKGALWLLTKRVSRAGKVAFRETPARRVLYHLREIEPELALEGG